MRVLQPATALLAQVFVDHAMKVPSAGASLVLETA